MASAAKGRSWSKEEDAIVVQTIRQDDTPSVPFTRWAELATTLCKQLPGSVRRTGKQCRDRYVNYLHPALTHEPFSRGDDLKLWNGYKDLGNKWTAISETIFQNTRSENHVKNRWNSATFKRFVREEYGNSVYEATKLAHGCAIPSQVVGPVKRKAVSPKKAPAVVHKKYGGSPSMMPGLPVLPTSSEEVSQKRSIHSHALPFAPWASEATSLPNNEHGMALPIVKRKKINEGWSPEEDALVTKAISHAKTNATEADSEFTNWAYLATLLPGRKGKQIRDRWKNVSCMLCFCSCPYRYINYALTTHGPTYRVMTSCLLLLSVSQPSSQPRTLFRGGGYKTLECLQRIWQPVGRYFYKGI